MTIHYKNGLEREISENETVILTPPTYDDITSPISDIGSYFAMKMHYERLGRNHWKTDDKYFTAPFSRRPEVI